jgi:hypothetical protein
VPGAAGRHRRRPEASQPPGRGWAPPRGICVRAPGSVCLRSRRAAEPARRRCRGREPGQRKPALATLFAITTVSGCRRALYRRLPTASRQRAATRRPAQPAETYRPEARRPGTCPKNTSPAPSKSRGPRRPPGGPARLPRAELAAGKRHLPRRHPTHLYQGIAGTPTCLLAMAFATTPPALAAHLKARLGAAGHRPPRAPASVTAFTAA